MVEAEEAPAIDLAEVNGNVMATADGSSIAVAEEAGPVVGGDANDADGDNSPAESASKTIPPHIPLSPPEDCIAVTPNRGVLKKVMEPGESDEKPSLHARCLIHYVGYLLSSGEAFMDTRTDRETEEPAVVVAGRTAAAQETGLCLAAATMSRGERALVYITDPSYGYGALGSFSFPAVPPHSQLVYEVEMVNWEGVEETDNDRDRGSLLFEERLERAERRREAGNAVFKEGRYKEALAKYALALSYMDEDFMYQLEGHYLDKAEAVKLKVHLNMAAAQLKTGDFNTAIYNCGQVLNIDPDNDKALFRRAKARHALLRTEEALQDLEAAIKKNPADSAIRAEIAAVKDTIAKEREAVKKMYHGRFAKPSGAAAADAGAAPAAAPAPEARDSGGGAADAPSSTSPAMGPEKRALAAAASSKGVAKSPPASRSKATRKQRSLPAAVGAGLWAVFGPLVSLVLGGLLWLGSMSVALRGRMGTASPASAARGRGRVKAGARR